MENLIKWAEYSAAERTELGTLATIGGKGTSMMFVPANYANAERRLVVILKRLDGTSASITCSPKVSALVRNKEITKAQLAGFPVCEQVTSGGEIFPQIQMPTGQGLIDAGSMDEVAEYKAKTFDPSELIAF